MINLTKKEQKEPINVTLGRIHSMAEEVAKYGAVLGPHERQEKLLSLVNKIRNDFFRLSIYDEGTK